MTFEQLNIIPPILRALKKENYENPSPIQEAAIPPALEGRDVLGCAQTGTGKTAAFAVPILQQLSANPTEKGKKRAVRSLILTPTRELALQISESFAAYGRFLDLRCTVVFGGVSQVPQVQQIRRGVDVLVATPGRLNDLINQKEVDLGKVEIFVLDEADRMLDMGFIHDVKKVISQVPRKKQTLFFSATMPPEITELVDSLLVDPVKVAVAPVSSTVDAIEQSAYFVDKGNKPKLLIHLLKDPAIVSALVFTRTKHGADRVTRELVRAKIPAQSIHGNKSQSARQLALTSFKNGAIRVLVATDIAARGIDIDELSHVINFDLPNIPETYVHRIGRTGRAGLSGTALSFCDIDEKPYLKDIEKLIKKKVPVIDHPYPMEVFTLTPPKQGNGRPQRAENQKPRSIQNSAPRTEAPKQEGAQQSAGGKNQQRNRRRGGQKPQQEGPQSQQKQGQQNPQNQQDRQQNARPQPPQRQGRQMPSLAEAETMSAKDVLRAAKARQERGPRRPPEQNTKEQPSAPVQAKPQTAQPQPQPAQPQPQAPNQQDKQQPGPRNAAAPAASYPKPPRRNEGPKPFVQQTSITKRPSDQVLTNKPFTPRKG